MDGASICHFSIGYPIMWLRKNNKSQAAILALAIWFVILTAFVDSFHLHPTGKHISHEEQAPLAHCGLPSFEAGPKVIRAAAPSFAICSSHGDFSHCPACWFIKNCNGYETGWEVPVSAGVSYTYVRSCGTLPHTSTSVISSFPRAPPVSLTLT
jgi:hypothetical protein